MILIRTLPIVLVPMAFGAFASPLSVCTVASRLTGPSTDECHARCRSSPVARS